MKNIMKYKGYWAKIQYSDEYYDLISGNNANVEFEPVFIKITK